MQLHIVVLDFVVDVVVIALQYGESIQANCALLGKSVKNGTKVAFCMLINLWVRTNWISVCKSNMAAKFKMAAVITVI